MQTWVPKSWNECLDAHEQLLWIIINRDKLRLIPKDNGYIITDRKEKNNG